MGCGGCSKADQQHSARVAAVAQPTSATTTSQISRMPPPQPPMAAASTKDCSAFSTEESCPLDTCIWMRPDGQRDHGSRRCLSTIPFVVVGGEERGNSHR